MRIVCQQTILMKYHALFVIFEKNVKILNCRLLQIIGGALRLNTLLPRVSSSSAGHPPVELYHQNGRHDIPSSALIG